jgi:hypothetical protein
MFDERLARVRKLIQQWDAIDAELAALFGQVNQPRRGRPRKDASADSVIANARGAGQGGEQ